MKWIRYLLWKLKGSPYREARLSYEEQIQDCPYTIDGRWTPRGTERWLVRKGLKLNETMERTESLSPTCTIFRERAY